MNNFKPDTNKILNTINMLTPVASKLVEGILGNKKKNKKVIAEPIFDEELLIGEKTESLNAGILCIPDGPIEEFDKDGNNVIVNFNIYLNFNFDNKDEC